jgi:hypothetical protein
MKRFQILYRTLALLSPLAMLGCGVILSSELRETRSIPQARLEGQEEFWYRTYAASATGTFDPVTLKADVFVDLMYEDICRRYVETHYVNRTEVRRVPAMQGLAVDSGLLVGGLVGSLFLESASVSAVVIFGALIPLGSNVVAYNLLKVTDSTPQVRREPDPAPEMAADGLFSCGFASETQASLHAAGARAKGSGGRYHLVLSEEQLRAAVSKEGVRLAAEIRPAEPERRVQDTAQWLEVPLGEAFAHYIAAVSPALAEKTLTQMVLFTVKYPESRYAAQVRSASLRRIERMINTDELRDITAIEGLHAELRKKAHARFTMLRVEDLNNLIPRRLLEIRGLERDVNTLLRNGFREAAEHALTQKKVFLAELCRFEAEVRLRERGVADREGGWRTTLLEEVDAAEAEAALRYLNQCD